MPQRIPRRGSVYYIRRVIPKDLQAQLGCKEQWVSLRTKEYEEAKRRYRIEDARFDDVFKRLRLTPTIAHLPIASVPWSAADQAYADASLLHQQEALEFFATMYAGDDENGLPYAEWLVHRQKRDEEVMAAFVEEERRNATLPLLDLFESYAARGNVRLATIAQFRAIIRHLIGFLGHDNALRVTKKDIVRWRNRLRDEQGPRGKPRTVKTINDSYLAAVRTVFGHGVDQLLFDDNPAKDVKGLPANKHPMLRDPDFTKEEQRVILRAALEPGSLRTSAHFAAARRWVPWLCAYTGARVNEITQLRGCDVREIDGVWTIRITPEAGTVKTNKARTVPLHEHLIAQGLLEFVSGKVAPLFYDPAARRKEAGRPQFKKVGMKLAEWVRSLGIGMDVQPNHAWRHTFKTITREVGIPEAAAHYIQGHAHREQGRKYGTHNLHTLRAELAKVPRFET